MRQIKFRGKTVYDDTLIYGDYHQYSRSECAIGDGKHLAFVKPESVAQLVGVDKDGKEVYEGDILVREFDGKRYEYKAHLSSFATSDDGGLYIGEKQFATSKLKEEINANTNR